MGCFPPELACRLYLSTILTIPRYLRLAQLHSGLDHMYSVLGDAFPEDELAHMLVRCSFDAEVAISHMLDGTGKCIVMRTCHGEQYHLDCIHNIPPDYSLHSPP